ncbi:hypothetical protein HMPREF6745_1585 [Prevotella sp. oral taxon 472 str. F0295]|nr:hypothetical protein HMPREF6745_1585 [Prevotella sp. oral taxon 472 str. F0295]
MNFFVKAYEQRQACLGFALAKNVHQLNGTFSRTERRNMLFEEREKHKHRSAYKGGVHSFSFLKSELSRYQKTKINIPLLLF